MRVEAVLSGKASLDWKKDSLELKIVVKDVSKRHGLLQDLADLRVDELADEVPVWLTLTPFLAQEKLDFDEEPQDAPTSAGQSEEGSGPEAPATDTMPDEGEVPSSGDFLRAEDEYQATGLPLYTIDANLDKDQLAEAAFQDDLPECVIQITRTIERDGRTLSQSTLYHYRGPGHDPVIRRVTGPQLRRWIDEMQAARAGATV